MVGHVKIQGKLLGRPKSHLLASSNRDSLLENDIKRWYSPICLICVDHRCWCVAGHFFCERRCWKNGTRVEYPNHGPQVHWQRTSQFSLGILVKVKVPKRKPLPTARFSSKFCYNLPANNSLQSTMCCLVQLKTVKGDFLMQSRFHCVQIFLIGFFTLAAKNHGKSDIHPWHYLFFSVDAVGVIKFHY